MSRLGLYQPFIEDRNVRRLYQLKVTYRERNGRKLPMTALINRILDDFFDTAAVSREADSGPPQETTTKPRRHDHDGA